MLGVIAAQVCRLLGCDQHHLGPLGAEVGGHQHPRVAGGLHDHRQLLGRAGGGAERHQIALPVEKPPPLPDQLPALVGQGGHVCRPHGQVDAQRCQFASSGRRRYRSPRSGSRPSVTSRTSELIGLRPSSVPNSSTGPCAGTEPPRPGPSFRSQESGLRSLRCARLDEKDGTNSVNPKWPESVPGGPLKC